MVLGICYFALKLRANSLLLTSFKLQILELKIQHLNSKCLKNPYYISFSFSENLQDNNVEKVFESSNVTFLSTLT